jgi:GNAT superfamily N-acetyltransferase
LVAQSAAHADEKATSAGVTVSVLTDDEKLLASLISFDANVFPEIDRADFMHRWLSLRSFTNARLAVARSCDGQVQGFGLIRPAEAAFRIGPLQARNSGVARLLLRDLAAHAESIDSTAMLNGEVPSCNTTAMQLFESLGFSGVFPCLRMYKGQPPVHNATQEFCIVNWEISF